MDKKPATTIIWARVMAGATLTFMDGTQEEFAWDEGKHGSIPVCHGGALSVETWETASSTYLSGIVYAPGVWKSIQVRTEMRKIELLNPQPQGAGH